MSEFRKQVEVIGVIVNGEEPGVNPNKATGQNGRSPKTTHIQPGTLLIIENSATYEKLKRMRAIRDYNPDTGSRTRSLESVFGPAQDGAFADAEKAAKEIEDLKAQQAERDALHEKAIEEAKQQAREEARREFEAEQAQARAAEEAKAKAADADGATKAKAATKGKSKGDATGDADDLV